MSRPIVIDEIDKKIIYYYRNNFPGKAMCEKIGISPKTLYGRLAKLRKLGMLKRWWNE